MSFGVLIDFWEEGLDSVYSERTKECDLSFLFLVSSLAEVKQSQDLIDYKENLRLKAQILLFFLQTGTSSQMYLTKLTEFSQLYLSKSGSGGIWNPDCWAQRALEWCTALVPVACLKLSLLAEYFDVTSHKHLYAIL